ncbi:hypothetical protein [Aneurinibacillus aneurinilyticus]|jgi:hypothetical protein|uniref:hypothetical protein n=1 Tax=Aneurinibacillus aneurinilyticus TaxID=1391 RepID=UPI0023F8CCC8|nr:hypothetical protein [Aneurinibacillus aneurinilyticus]MCI1693997.1 hypothetical protein [Aneurinibacillus aneurinilyticus]
MSKRKSKKIPVIAVMSTLAVTALASSVSADTIIRNSTLNGLQVSSSASIYTEGRDTSISRDVVIKAPTTLTASSNATNPFSGARIVIETSGTVTVEIPLKEVYINSNATIDIKNGGSIQRVIIASGKNPKLPPGIPGSVTQLATPGKPSVSGTKVSWNAVQNATKYSVEIYKGSSKEKTINNVTTTSLDLSDQKLAVGTYTVKVKAIGNGNTYGDSALSSASSSVAISTPLATPGKPSVSGTKVSWEAVTDATKYSVEIYKADGNIEKTVDNGKATSLDLSTQKLAAGTYTVKVKAIGNRSTYGDSASSVASEAVTVSTQLTTPSKLSITGTTVSWYAVPNATKYLIEIYKEDETKEKTLENVTATSIDLATENLAVGKYKVKVQAIGNGSTYGDSALSSFSSLITLTTQLATPSKLSITGTTVSWEEVPNATKYMVEIYKEDRSKWKTVSNGMTTSIDLSIQRPPAGKYTVKVKAVGNGSTYSDSALSEASEVIAVTA